MSTHDLTTAASGGGGDAAPSAGAAAARGLGPRPWPRDFSTRVVPRFEPPYTLGEDVFSLPLGALNDVLSCLKLGDASQLRLVSRDAEAHVSAFKWADASTPVRSLKHWRACFPRAVALCMHDFGTAPDWRLLNGLTTLSLSCCDLSQLRRSGLDDALAGIRDVRVQQSSIEQLIATFLDATVPPQLASAAGAALVSLQRADVALGDEEALLSALSIRSLLAGQAVVLARALMHAYGAHPFSTNALLDGRGAFALITLLERFPRDAAVQEAGLRALALFTPSFRAPTGMEVLDWVRDSNGEPGRAAPRVPFVKRGTAEVAAAALAAHGAASASITQAACTVLFKGAEEDERVAPNAVSAGALPGLLAALQTYLHLPAVATAALQALSRITQPWSDNPVMTAFCTDGWLRVLSAVRTMLRDPLRYAEALGAACWLFRELVRSSRTRTAAFVEGGGLDVLVGTLQAGGSERRVVMPAAQVLQLLSEHTSLRQQLLAAGLVPPAVTAIAAICNSPMAYDGTYTVRLLCDALGALGASEAGAAAIEEAGGLQVLVAASRTSKLQPYAREDALQIARAIAKGAPRRQQIIAAALTASVRQ